MLIETIDLTATLASLAAAGLTGTHMGATENGYDDVLVQGPSDAVLEWAQANGYEI